MGRATLGSNLNVAVRRYIMPSVARYIMHGIVVYIMSCDIEIMMYRLRRHDVPLQAVE
jgi:hypothetical protein